LALTAGIDSVTGTADNDIINALETSDNPARDTLTALDTIDGGGGRDTLNVVEDSAIDTTGISGLSVSNVEVANFTSTGTVIANTTAWSGLTSLKVTAADDIAATAAATTDVVVDSSNLSGAAGDELTVNGGKSVTVTATDTSTTAAASVNDIAVGGTTAAAGKVSVSYTETVSDASNAGIVGGAITVTGGTSVEVNSNAVAGVGSAAADVLTLGTVAVNGNASTTDVSVSQSAATATWAAAGDKISIVNGIVTIIDANVATASDTISTVSLQNFGASTITSSVLSTLNVTGGATAALASGSLGLAQSAADTSTVATTLNLNANGGFMGAISGTQAAEYTTVNVASSANSTVANASFAKATTLNVSGAGTTALTAFTAANNTALTSIASTGAGLTIGTELATTVAVTGGAGVENVLIGATTKAIDLGDGNDVVTVSTTSLGAGGSVKGGDGIDTLVANTSGSAFAGLPAFTGFETLRVAGAAADGAHNANGFTALELGATSNVASSFTNVADNVGLTVLASLAAAHTVTLADATGTTTLGTAETLGLTLSSAGVLDATTNGITIAGVETFNITTTDTDTTAHTNTLDLTAAAAESIVVTGNTGLDMTGSTYANVTNFDASGVTGAATDAAALAVTYVSGNSTVAESVTIKGGSGNDSLTGSVSANDTISGGAGVDTLVYTGGSDSFDGGAGNDIFDVNAVGTKTSFLKITAIAVGDTVDFAGATANGTLVAQNAAAMAASKVTLGSAATFDQYLDAAADQDGSANGTFEWFQFGGNTFGVISNDDGTVGTSAGFTSGTDAIVQFSGVVDLSSSAIAAEVLTIA